MELISYVTISNFKGFGEDITVNFSQPSILIGPNNSGKTTVLQALAMWNMGIKTWFREKGGGKSKSKRGTSINRLNITQVPIKEARFFWQNGTVRTGTVNNELKITVGLVFRGEVKPCTIIFTYFNTESIYCFPDENSIHIEGLLAHASTLEIKILYPMSGIAREEPLIQEGRIDVLIGQGQTSEVLRNLCYKIVENDKNENTDDWQRVTNLMKQLFHIFLTKPFFNTAQGTVELSYQTDEIKGKKGGLDIGLSGRGQQEMLLLIAYLYTHKGAILLLDEPDAHLELLRQKQVFSVLKHLAIENGNQLILATHSEVILNEAAENNLTLLLDGKAINLSENGLKNTIKSTLRDYGLEHYYKARICKSVLYTEGSTDIEMLRAFAIKLNHRAKEVLDAKIYSYYTADNEPFASLTKDINQASGYYNNAKKHFKAIQSCIPEFKGIGIFDSDNERRTDEITPNRALLYWRKYELENYFALPYVINKYVINYLEKQGRTSIEIEQEKQQITIEIDKVILTELLNNNQKALDDFNLLPSELKKEVFKNTLSNHKGSRFLEKCFSAISARLDIPLILSKGNFYELIAFIELEDINLEITEKLNYLVEYLG